MAEIIVIGTRCFHWNQKRNRSFYIYNIFTWNLCVVSLMFWCRNELFIDMILDAFLKTAPLWSWNQTIRYQISHWISTGCIWDKVVDNDYTCALLDTSNTNIMCSWLYDDLLMMPMPRCTCTCDETITLSNIW